MLHGRKRNNIAGFTVLEVMVVIVIASILLAMMMHLGWNYIKTLSYQQDRERYVGAINEFITRGRTTNYYGDVKYTYIDIMIDKDHLTIMYGTGDASTAACATGGTQIHNIIYKHSSLSGITLSLPYTFRIEPYQLGCNSYCSASGSASTGIIASESTVSKDKTCFLFDGNLCKMNLTACP